MHKGMGSGYTVGIALIFEPLRRQPNIMAFIAKRERAKGGRTDKYIRIMVE